MSDSNFVCRAYIRLHTLQLGDLMPDNTLLFAGPLCERKCVWPTCDRRSYGRGVFEYLYPIVRVSVVVFVSECSGQISYERYVLLPTFWRMIMSHSLVARGDFVSHTVHCLFLTRHPYEKHRAFCRSCVCSPLTAALKVLCLITSFRFGETDTSPHTSWVTRFPLDTLSEKLWCSANFFICYGKAWGAAIRKCEILLFSSPCRGKVCHLWVAACCTREARCWMIVMILNCSHDTQW